MDIFQEMNIAGMHLKNRIIRSATHEGIDFPGEELKNIYVNLVKGGVGAIITGFVGVHQFGRAAPKMPMFYSHENQESWAILIKEIKNYGTPIILQLGHGGGKSLPVLIGRNGLSPSSYQYNQGQFSDEMSGEEIREVIQSYADCIESAKNIGFDGVQIQASHGYLMSEFLSPRLNQRKDEWGGSTENRFRIIREIFLEARKRVGDYPILVKISAYDSEEGGMQIEESIKIAKLLQDATCDAIEVSCGNENFFEVVRPAKPPVEAIMAFQSEFKNLSLEKKKATESAIAAKIKIPEPVEDCNVPAAEMIKKAVDIQVIVVGGIRKLSSIRNIIENGKADFVALSRPFIIEPDIVNKMKNGIQNESRCLNCSYCLVNRGRGMKCYYGKITE